MVNQYNITLNYKCKRLIQITIATQNSRRLHYKINIDWERNEECGEVKMKKKLFMMIILNRWVVNELWVRYDMCAWRYYVKYQRSRNTEKSWFNQSWNNKWVVSTSLPIILLLYLYRFTSSRWSMMNKRIKIRTFIDGADGWNNPY